MSSHRRAPAVFVTWHDSAHAPGWDPRDLHEGLTPALVHSVGFLLRRDKKSLVLAMSAQQAGSTRFANSLVIPRACVSSVRRLRATS